MLAAQEQYYVLEDGSTDSTDSAVSAVPQSKFLFDSIKYPYMTG